MPFALYALVAVASGALSLWEVAREPVTNPDGALYMMAAEYFAALNWAAGRSVYPWPLYSLLISVVMRAGVDAFTAAQILNAVFDAAIAVLLVDVVRRLGCGDRVLTTLAAGLVLLSPRLIQIRAVLVRDHGFLLFYLLVVDLLVRDFSVSSWRNRIGMGAAIVAAACFRTEGLFLLVLIPGFYLYRRAPTRSRRLAVVIGCLAACAGLPFAYYFKHEALRRLVHLDTHSDLPPLSLAFEFAAARVEVLREWTPGAEWPALTGLLLGIFVYRGIRGVGTLVFSVSLLAFTRAVRERHGFALRLLVWLSIGQLLMVLAYLSVEFDMNYRYVLPIALCSTIGVALVLRELIRVWPKLSATGPRRPWVLPTMVLALLASFAYAVPRGAPVHLKAAGEWLRGALSSQATILTNDIRVLYYSRRLAVDSPSTVDARAADAPGKWSRYDYLALDVRRGSTLERRLEAYFGRPPDRVIGDGAARVLVFRTRDLGK